ncbi:MAG: rhodanese-like domain-containing protein [Candidatus Hodarchaeales archaeon]|jgi:rhodanese-related sulfurtransferase
MVNYYLKNLIRYWRIFGKLVVHRCWNFNKCWTEITVDELFDRFNSDNPPLILDIRSAQEFNDADGHIPNSKSIPIVNLKSNFEELQPFKEKEIVTICPGGGMSMIAVDILEKAGFTDAKSLHGGLDLWKEKGYPITTTPS